MAEFDAKGNNKRASLKSTLEREQQLKEAFDYHKRGNITKAEDLYKELLEEGYLNEALLLNLGVIYKTSGKLQEALLLYKQIIDINKNNHDAHTNLGSLYINLGKLDQALASTLKSLELKPDNPTAHMNLGSIYKEHGNLNQALASTLKSLELKPDNPIAHMNLGGIYKQLDNLDQALNSILKSLELKPGHSKSLYLLATIKTAYGDITDAKKLLLDAIKSNPQECAPYYELSLMISTTAEADELKKSIQSVKTAYLTTKQKTFIEFAISNCFHKLQDYGQAAKHLQSANKHKLILLPSNADLMQKRIASHISPQECRDLVQINNDCGSRKIFIVGMPRSGSTLLETILSTNPEIKDLGESKSLGDAIMSIQKHPGNKPNQEDLDTIYSQLAKINEAKYKYTIDKQLYNFIYVAWIAHCMPEAKIIHCCRNPMDNILSMYRSNLSPGNNYTSNLEDAAKVLISQENAMQIHKARYPKKIFTFDYDEFVNAPEAYLSKLLSWLDLKFNQTYLNTEKNKRAVNTASATQARKPISNKSVGGWKKYKRLLEPARCILQNSGVLVD